MYTLIRLLGFILTNMCRYAFFGFNILELMVVVSIIGILAAMGYPSYVSLKTSMLRADAHASLITTFNMLERYRAQNNLSFYGLVSEINSNSDFDNYSSSSSTPVLSSKGLYRITIDAPGGGAAFTIEATATVNGTSLVECNSTANANTKQCRDTQCRIIKLSESNVKTSTNSNGDDANASSTLCW